MIMGDKPHMNSPVGEAKELGISPIFMGSWGKDMMKPFHKIGSEYGVQYGG